MGQAHAPTRDLNCPLGLARKSCMANIFYDTEKSKVALTKVLELAGEDANPDFPVSSHSKICLLAIHPRLRWIGLKLRGLCSHIHIEHSSSQSKLPHPFVGCPCGFLTITIKVLVPNVAGVTLSVMV